MTLIEFKRKRPAEAASRTDQLATDETSESFRFIERAAREGRRLKTEGLVRCRGPRRASRPPQGRMTLSRIEPVPKDVEFATPSDGRFATKPGIDLARCRDDILDIRDPIVAGRELPRHYHRCSTGQDDLLETLGWPHRHVGYGIDDDVLLIVEQTADTVIVIGLTNRDLFRGRPKGKSPAGLGSRIARVKLGRTSRSSSTRKP